MLLYLCQYIAELGIVDDYTIVEVEANGSFGYYLQAVVILTAFIKSLAELVTLAALSGGELGTVAVKGFYLALERVDVGQQILRADTFGSVGIHTVHVGDALEGAFLRAEQPVDGTVLMHLLMVFPIVLDEVLLQGLTKTTLHVVEVVGKMILTEDNADEGRQAVDHVVAERTVVGQQWDDAIIVDDYLLAVIVVCRQILCRRVRISNVQSGLIEAVAAHAHSHEVADELFDEHVIVPFDMLVVCFHCHLFLSVCTSQ